MVAALVSLLISLPAFAQGADGHGTTPGAPRAEPIAPLLLSDPWVGPAGTGSLTALGELALSPLVRIEEDQGTTEVPVLETVGGAYLAGRYTLLDRVSLGAVLPVWAWVDGAPAAGDLLLHAPIGLIRTEDHQGPAVSVEPFLSLPTGASERLVGETGVGGGGVVALGYGQGPLITTGELGIELDPAGLLPGGPVARGGLGAGLALTDRAAVHIELRGRSGLTADNARRGTPVEASAAARGTLPGQLWWAAGVGRGIVGGAGAAALRVHAGVGMALGGPQDVVDEIEPVAVTPTVLLQVRDPAGTPVRAARVALPGVELGTTDVRGQLPVDRDLPWDQGVTVQAPGLTTTVVSVAPDSDQAVLDATLAWRSVDTTVVVVDQNGRQVDAQLSMASDQPVPDPVSDDTGTSRFALQPGTYTLTVAAPELATQRRTIVVPQGREQPIRVDVGLFAPTGEETLQLTFTDEAGSPVEGALVRLQGLPVGTTTSGGDLGLDGLSAGTSTVAVTRRGFDDTTFDVAIGEQPVAVATLVPEIGTVRVHTSGPDGAPSDAEISFTGPSAVPPRRLGRQGEGTFLLEQGTWVATATSPTLGQQQRRFTVDEDTLEPVALDLILQADEQGPADLTVTVTDPAGRALPRARVSLDGLPVGTTASDGMLRLTGLDPGERVLSVELDNSRSWEQPVLLLGRQQVDAVLEWTPGTVYIRARGPGGRPLEGMVRASSEGRTASGALDPLGDTTLHLDPGTWSILVSAPPYGMQARTVVVDPHDSRFLILPLWFLEAAEGDGQLGIEVRAPDGSAVEGARVRLGDSLLGYTSNTGDLRIGGLDPGRGELEVTADGHQPWLQSIDIRADTEQQVTLPWAGGVAKVRCEGPEGPMQGVLLRFSGPSVLPSMATGVDGLRSVPLASGPWMVLASTPNHDLQHQQFEIPEDGGSTVEVTFTFEEQPSGVLVVRITDDSLRPVPGADIRLDGTHADTTTAGGAALIDGVAQGAHELAIAPPAPMLHQQLSFELVSRSAEVGVIVPWPRIPVQVHTSSRGAGAELWFEGPEMHPTLQADTSGRADVTLRPGMWTVHARTDDDAVGATQFTVDAGMEELRVDVPLEASGISLTDGKVQLEQVALFDVGEHELRPGSAPTLDALATRLRVDHSVAIAEVQGHTDDQGGLDYNLALSERRAESVLEALVARGVPRERLQAVGYAMLRPVMAGTSDAARAANRRVDIEVVEAGW